MLYIKVKAKLITRKIQQPLRDAFKKPVQNLFLWGSENGEKSILCGKYGKCQTF